MSGWRDELRALLLRPTDDVATDPSGHAAGSLDAVDLLDGQLGAAGDHAEGLIAAAGDALRPGGLLLAAAPGTVHAQATGAVPEARTFTAAQLAGALQHRGFTVELQCAPGATALLGGRSADALDLAADRRPGLLDAAPHVVAVGRAPADEAARSGAFFAGLPRKVVAAAVLCRDDQERVLVVHDTFKQHWTIPGGVVDADEDPRSGAVREAWEEAGVRVEAGALLGLFSASWPDRLVLVYAARPVGGGPQDPAPVHAHEVGAAAWVPLDEALARLAPAIADQVRCCLAAPGQTWRR